MSEIVGMPSHPEHDRSHPAIIRRRTIHFVTLNGWAASRILEGLSLRAPSADPRKLAARRRSALQRQGG